MAEHDNIPPADLPDAVAAFIDARRLIPPDAAVLLAVSGGADSVAMLHALLRLAGRADRAYRLAVAHLDHALRPNSADDAAWVADHAGGLGLPCKVARVDVRQLAARDGVSIETAARNARYDFLAREADALGCPFVATAHHADDNVETVLHRIVRGTGLDGLRGIHPSRPLGDAGLRLVRPMLAVTREQVLAFCRIEGLSWRTDPTNADTAHTRNRIRHELLPLLRERFNPRVDDALSRLAATAEWAGQWLDELGDEALRQCLAAQSVGRVDLLAEPLESAGPMAASQAIRAALRKLGAPMRCLGHQHVRRVMDLLADGPTGRAIDLPAGLRARRQYDLLVLEAVRPADSETASPRVPGSLACPERSRSGELGSVCNPVAWPRAAMAPAEPDGAAGVNATEEAEIPLAAPGATALPDGATLTIEFRDADQAAFAAFLQHKTPFEEMLDADRLTGELLARRRRPGDRFRPLGAPGAQKLSDFFVTQKVPEADRDEAWIVRDARGIVWVAPHRIDDRVRVTPATTRVAVMRLHAGGTPATLSATSSLTGKSQGNRLTAEPGGIRCVSTIGGSEFKAERQRMAELPDYTMPPVVEVAIGVRFKPLLGLSVGHVGLYWQTIRDTFCRVEEQVPIARILEPTEGSPDMPQGFQVTDKLDLPRAWFLDATGNRLIQLQRDRFLHNWRKLEASDEYPRFQSVRDCFFRHWEGFKDFLAENNLRAIPDQCELTYVNHIRKGQGWSSMADLGQLFSTFAWRTRTAFLPSPETARWSLRFALPENQGRLYVDVAPARIPQEDEPVIRLTLTARGRPQGELSAASMSDWFLLAREWIVKGFVDLVDPRTDAIWELKA